MLAEPEGQRRVKEGSKEGPYRNPALNHVFEDARTNKTMLRQTVGGGTTSRNISETHTMNGWLTEHMLEG